MPPSLRCAAPSTAAHCGQSTSSSWKPAPSSRIVITSRSCEHLERERDLPDAGLGAVAVVGVTDGVGARLGERQLEVGDGVGGEAAFAKQAGERQASEDDVLGLGRDLECDRLVHVRQSYLTTDETTEP